MGADPSDQLLSFQSVQADPRHQPDPVVLAWLARDVRAFGNSASELDLGPGFIRAMSGLVVEAFRQLDALSRGDGFWDGTNGRPTPNKLGPFCETLLRDRPDDTRALWMRAAVASVNGFGYPPDVWRRLIAVDCPDVTWPISAAAYAECVGSYETANDLAVSLAEAGRGQEALPELAQMRQASPNTYLTRWAGRVIDGLKPFARKGHA
jgi:hypothetical protein